MSCQVDILNIMRESSQNKHLGQASNNHPNSNSNSNSNSTSLKHATNNGTTSVIRKRLNFTDEALWKQFSSRRLQLVESLSLSSKKASEQDEEIKICANTLMHEFNFPDSTLSEFDKLVRLAIQSVRRNKKRSEKRLASKLETLTSDEEQYSLIKRTKTDNISSNNNSYNNNDSTNNNNNNNNNNSNNDNDDNDEDEDDNDNDDDFSNNANLNFLSNVVLDEDDNYMTNTNINNLSKPLPIKSTNALTDFSILSNTENSSSNLNLNDKIAEHHDSRVAINSLIGPIIPDLDRLPSLKKLDENSEFTKASQKILHAIKNSKSCFEFSRNSASNSDFERTKNYDLLEEFGSNCITSAVLYTLEKWFDHLLPDSSSYIKLRLKSDLTLGLIVKNLDKSSVEVNRLNNYVASQLFKKLIGGCVKDFGFDSTLNPLCDIFHSIILKDYPIITKDQIKSNSNTAQSNNLKNEKNNNYFKDLSIIDSTISQPNIFSIDVNLNSSNNSHSSLSNTNNPIMHNKQNDSILSTRVEIPDFPLSTAHIPIPHISDHALIDSNNILPTPPVLRTKQYTHVVIKFKGKELKFRYCIDSNAPPTILELISNCKQAFGIVNSTRTLSLKDLRSDRIIKNDHDLERMLRMAAMLSNDGNGEIGLELVFANVTQGYLNLNYDTNSTEHNLNKTTDKSIGDNTSNINNNNNNNNNNNINTNTNNNNTSNNNNNNSIPPSTGDSLLGRYLPPPRPIRPDTTPMGGFMKFQPLL